MGGWGRDERVGWGGVGVRITWGGGGGGERRGLGAGGALISTNRELVQKHSDQKI